MKLLSPLTEPTTHVTRIDCLTTVHMILWKQFSPSFFYQYVVWYDRWHVDWSRYCRRSYDKTKLPGLSVIWITRTTRGCPFGYTACYVLSPWRSPYALYPTCDATSQWHSLIGGSDEATEISRRNPVRCWFMELGEEWSVRKKSGYTRRTAWSHNGHRPHKGTSSCNHTSNTPCPHTSCKVHWCWQWNFWKCIVLGKMYQLCHLNNKYWY